MRDGKLRVGMVGAGGIGRDQHLPGWLSVPFAEVVALADLSPLALEQAGRLVPHAYRYSAWKNLLARDDLDVVDICTPNRTHADIALSALATGRHVLCEKPLATTSAEVIALRDAASRGNRVLMTAQHFRFDGVSRQVKRWIDAGMVGNIYYARAQWLRRRSLPARPTFTDPRLSGGGPALDIGVHVLDLAFWLMGAPKPVSVTAAVGTHLARRPDLAGDWGEWDHKTFQVEDFAAGFVRFANGATLTLESSWLAFQPERETIRLQGYGTEGGFVWPEGLLASESQKTPWDLKYDLRVKNRPHHDAIRAFADAVRESKPSPVPVEETLQVVRMLEALYQSSAEGREVILDPKSRRTIETGQAA